MQDAAPASSSWERPGSAAAVELGVCYTPHGRVVNTGKAGMTKEAAFAQCRESYSKLCFAAMNV